VGAVHAPTPNHANRDMVEDNHTSNGAGDGQVTEDRHRNAREIPLVVVLSRPQEATWLTQSVRQSRKLKRARLVNHARAYKKPRLVGLEVRSYTSKTAGDSGLIKSIPQ